MTPDGPSDFGACYPWPPGFEAHLDSYRQGHIIDGIPAFFLQADVHLWLQPRQQLSTQAPIVVGEASYPLRRVMLLTQACDLMKKTNPWITVSPVYDAYDRVGPGQRGQIKSGQFGHFIHLTAEWAANQLWVVDLRLEIPVEKTVLLGRSPIEAFSDDAGYAELAQRLGARRQRLAAPQPCIDLVVNPLFEALRSQPDGGNALNAQVHELRVQWNDPTSPTIVTVFVVAQDESSRQAIDAEGWKSLVLGLYQQAQGGGITIVGPEITSMDDMSAADYIQSSPIHDTQSS